MQTTNTPNNINNINNTTQNLSDFAIEKLKDLIQQGNMEAIKLALSLEAKNKVTY